MAVTLKMLSEQTGFSPATISRVLNNDPSMTVGEDTRRIIFDAAHRLGYSGSSGRRNQRTLTDTLFIGIAEMLSHQLCLAVNNIYRTLVTCGRTNTAAIAFFFINMNDFSNHVASLILLFSLSLRIP